MKLSKGVLGLKFMRKTKEQIDQTVTEKKHREFYGNGNFKSEPGTNPSAIPSRVVACPSYLHCERFNYARQSYGGMNPSVEDNVKKGLWRIEYELPALDEGGETDSHGTEEVSVKVKLERDSGNSESDSEDDDGPVVGSIIGTIGKRFNKKAKNERKRPHDSVQDSLSEASVAIKKQKKSKPWKNFSRNKEAA